MANETLLLLHCEGADGSTSLVDSSGWGRSPIVGGNAQLSTTKAKFGGSSIYFDGTGDYVKYPSNADFGFGTGDFTIEFWVYPLRNSGNECFLDMRTADAQGPYIGKDGTGKIRAYDGTTVRTGGQIDLNVWSHIAWTRGAGMNTVYLNGVEILGFSSSFNMATTRPVTLGTYWALSADFYQGYIDELRITKSLVLYSTNVTPPTSTLTVPYLAGQQAVGTSLHLHFEGANDSTNFIDSSGYGKKITPFGNVKISTAQSKFGSSSAYFDGAGDYLVSPIWAAPIGIEDWTLELWAYPTAFPSGSQPKMLVQFLSTFGINLEINQTSQKIGLYSHGDNTYTQSINPISLNTWYHVAVVRYNNVLTLYVNGVTQGTLNTTRSYNNTKVYIGKDSTVTTRDYTGYIDEFRLVRGRALYTSDFTPVSSAHPDVDPAPVLDLATQLLMHFDGANDSTIFKDSAWLNKTFTVGGNARISTAQSKFGSSSAIFDGSGDYIQVTDSLLGDCYTYGAVTIECWIHPLANTDHVLFQNFTNTGSVNGFQLSVTSSGGVSVYAREYYVINNAGAGSVLVGQWSHVALVIEGQDAKVYIDGVLRGSGTFSTTGNLLSTDRTWIGGNIYGSSVNGYLDEFRFTRGIARYKSDFTPAGPFPDADLTYSRSSNTALLLSFNGSDNSTTFIDDSYYGRKVTPVGDAKISSTQSKFGGSSGYFDGVGDYLSITGYSNLYLPGDFTIEAFIRVESFATRYGTILSNAQGTFNSASCYLMVYGDADTTPRRFSFGSWTGGRLLVSSSQINASQFYHVAVTRKGDVCRLFVDGVLSAVATSTQNFEFGNPSLRVGHNIWNAADGYFSGYVDDLRIINGEAAYVANFTPPTIQFSDSAPPDFLRLNLQFNGADGSSIFTDSSSYNWPITNNGTAQNYQLPYEPTRSVGKFPDNTANVKTIPNTLLDIRDRAFTLSCWIYGTDISLGSPIYSRTSPTYGISYEQYFFLQPDGLYLYYGIRGTNQANARWLFTFYPDKWYHIVWQRDQLGVWSVFVDGTELFECNYSGLHGGGASYATEIVGKYVNSVDFLGTALSHVIHGAEAWTPGQDNVLLEDFRLVIGTTEYSGNFSPPDAPVVPISLANTRAMSADTEVISSVLAAAQISSPSVEIISVDGSTGITSTQIVFEVLSSSSQTRRRPIVFVVT